LVLVKRLRVLGLIAAMVAVMAIGAAAPVAADYGNSGGNVQLYQATASMNCNNPSLCPQGLGGFWAWAEFNADGTFSGEVTFCAHLRAPGGFNGAGHEHVDGHYAIVDFGPNNPWIVLVDEVDVLTGLGGGQTVVVTSEFVPVGPAAKAKLSTADFFGFSAPGVTFQVTVTPMHT